MLVLTRKPKQRIFVGKNRELIIEVIRTQQGIVHLGIEADAAIPIVREEIAPKQDEVSVATRTPHIDLQPVEWLQGRQSHVVPLFRRSRGILHRQNKEDKEDKEKKENKKHHEGSQDSE